MPRTHWEMDGVMQMMPCEDRLSPEPGLQGEEVLEQTKASWGGKLLRLIMFVSSCRKSMSKCIGMHSIPDFNMSLERQRLE